MIGNLINSNPQMKQANEIINQYGGDVKTAFYKTAEAKGVDPNEILDMLK